MRLPTYLDGSTIALPRQSLALDKPQVVRRPRGRLDQVLVAGVFTVLCLAVLVYPRAFTPFASVWLLALAVFFVRALRPPRDGVLPRLSSHHDVQVDPDIHERVWTFGLTNNGEREIAVEALAWTVTLHGMQRVYRDIPSLHGGLGAPLGEFAFHECSPPHLYLSPAERATLLAIPGHALDGVTGIVAHLAFRTDTDTHYAYDIAVDVPDRGSLRADPAEPSLPMPGGAPPQ